MRVQPSFVIGVVSQLYDTLGLKELPALKGTVVVLSGSQLREIHYVPTQKHPIRHTIQAQETLMECSIEKW